MNPATENVEKNPSPAMEPGTLWTDGRVVRMASRRVHVFPKEAVGTTNKVTVPEDKRCFILDSGYHEFTTRLMREGMPPGLAVLFIHLLWRVGDDFSWRVSTTSLAKGLGRQKNSVTNDLTKFRKAHLIRKHEPATFPARWDFPVYENLIERVAEWFGNRLKQDGGEVLPDPD